MRDKNILFLLLKKNSKFEVDFFVLFIHVCDCDKSD